DGIEDERFERHREAPDVFEPGQRLLELPGRLETLKDAHDLPAHLIGERLRDLLLGQVAELDADLAEAKLLVDDERVGHLADDLDVLRLRELALPEEQTSERLAVRAF